MPEYLKEDSPLDPPGTAAARAEMRAKYLKEGVFAKDARPEVNGGKILICSRNPEREKALDARYVETATVKIIACEGTYYFVEADGGERGYVKETDLINPAALPPLPEGQDGFGPLLPGDTELLPGQEDDGPAGVELQGNQKLMQDRNGRNVIITDKKTDRSGEFEARQKALQQGQKLPARQYAEEPGEDLPASSLDR